MNIVPMEISACYKKILKDSEKSVRMGTDEVDGKRAVTCRYYDFVLSFRWRQKFVSIFQE